MTDRTFELELVAESGDCVCATMRVRYRLWTEKGFSKSEVRLEFRWPWKRVRASDYNYFDALCRAREQLSALGFKPRCYGACRNLVVTGMWADMASGEVGYLTELGRPVTRRDMVNIFDSGPDMDLVSVDEQAAYRKEWKESVSKRHRPDART